jgi:hypothetical protein
MAEKPPSTESPKTIRFAFRRADGFREYFADGVYGGVTPTGKIHMVFYTDQSSLPEETTHQILPNGHLGSEIKERRVQEEDTVDRFLKAGVTISAASAKSLISWLEEKIEALERTAPEGEVNGN